MENDSKSRLSNYVKYQRSKWKMTQEELAEKGGVGLRFVRELEQGKETLRMDKVNQLLMLFGSQLEPGNARKTDAYAIAQYQLNRILKLTLTNNTEMIGMLVEPILEFGEITAWRFVPGNTVDAYLRNRNPGLTQIIQHREIEKVEIL